MTPQELLAAYDNELREEAEFPPEVPHQRHGPLLWVRFPRRGFVTYRDISAVRGDALEQLIIETTEHFRDTTDLASAEWKSRGHDETDGLHDRLVRHGWVPEEVETVMVGEAAALAVDVALPPGVVVRRAGESTDTAADLESDVRRLLAMQETVFGPDTGPLIDDVLRVIREGVEEYWLAEVDGEVISGGRLTPVPDTAFAGLWGGTTLPHWRGRGVYRTLTAARARSALERGVRLLHSDCTAMSRPILQRAGLVAITTTTPYVWSR